MLARTADSEGSAQQLLQLIRNRGYTVAPTRRPEVASDLTTTSFLAYAGAAHADYLVTGNRTQFPRFWKKTKIVPRGTSSVTLRLIS